MHVLHVVDALAVGGAERMLVELANRAVADGHRVSVCVTRSGLALAGRLDPRIEVVVLGRRRRFEVRPLVRLARWCAAHDVDVLHCHGRSSFSLVALLEATRLLRRPAILHDHHNLSSHSDVPRWFRVASRFASAYVAAYAEMRTWASAAGLPDDRVHVITNAVDMESVDRRATANGLPRRDDMVNLVFIGGLRREKAVDVLLRALAQLHARAVLHVIGGDADPRYADECRELARQLGVEDRVVFHGVRDDAMGMARNADLAVHSSRSESGPLVLIEYAAIGLPFVATTVGGVAAELRAAGVGRYVAPEDATALATAIDEMLAMPANERAQLGRSWGERARGIVDISAVMPAWYSLYAQVTA